MHRRLPPTAILAATLAFSAALCTVALAAPVQGDAPPFPGVYGCYGTYYSMGDQFGLINRTTYSTFNGGRGHYRYDPTTQILTMVDGPRKGLRYKRQSEKWTFSVLQTDGGPTGQSCPYNPSKDPTKPRW